MKPNEIETNPPPKIGNNRTLNTRGNELHKTKKPSQGSAAGKGKGCLPLGEKQKTYCHPPQLYTDTDKKLQPLRKGTKPILTCANTMTQSRDGVQEEQETVLYPTFPIPTNIRQSSVVGLEEEQQTQLHSEIRDKSCSPLGKRQIHQESTTLRFQHTRLPKAKVGTGELKSLLFPTTKLIPSKEEKAVYCWGEAPRENPLWGSGGQSLMLKAESGARRPKRSLQHSKLHTRHKVAIDYLEEVEAYEQQLEQQQNPN